MKEARKSVPKRRPARAGRARATFLEVLEATCNVSEAARQAGVPRRTVYDWRTADAEFAQAWSDAEEAAANKLEEVAFTRATTGQSDRMLEILLKAHRPKYREKQNLELTGKDGGPIETVMSDAEAFTRAVAGLAARGSAGS